MVVNFFTNFEKEAKWFFVLGQPYYEKINSVEEKIFARGFVREINFAVHFRI